jgi:hypothetical protein
VSPTTAPAVVTQQSQEISHTVATVGTVASFPYRPTNDSPVCDHHAIASMTAGDAAGASSIPVSLSGEGYATGRLELFKERSGKKKTAKLNQTSVFNYLRQGFINDLANDLTESRRTPPSSSHSVRKDVSSFDTITYTRQTKVDVGKSRRIAEQGTRKVQATVTPETIRQADEPLFDIKKATKLARDINWNELKPNFSLDSHKLRRYIVEDVMFADPKQNERLLLLVSDKHAAFKTTWLPIYREQQSSRAPIMFDRDMYFQIEAEVVKNSKRKNYVDGLLSEEEVQYQLSYQGGAGVCLHFPFCKRANGIELKFASILLDVTTFQVWGTRELRREFGKKLAKLKNDANREALFCC